MLKHTCCGISFVKSTRYTADVEQHDTSVEKVRFNETLFSKVRFNFY